MPIRIQRKRTKGWRMPEGAVYVGRPTIFGNPFVVGSYCTLEQSIDLFRHALDVCWSGPYVYEMLGDDDVLAHADYQMWRSRFGSDGAVETIRCMLRGKDLACFCPLDRPCHADALLEIANGGPV